MNYLVRYEDFDGEIITFKTFTYYEAEAIVKHVKLTSTKNHTIKPLNEKARKIMRELLEFEKTIDEIKEVFKKFEVK